MHNGTTSSVCSPPTKPGLARVSNIVRKSGGPDLRWGTYHFSFAAHGTDEPARRKRPLVARSQRVLRRLLEQARIATDRGRLRAIRLCQGGLAFPIVGEPATMVSVSVFGRLLDGRREIRDRPVEIA